MALASIELNANGQARPFHYRTGGSDERVIQEVLRGREYDFARLRRGPELNALYGRLAQSGKAPLVVDAGANIGASAIWFACSFPAARVVAIEPEAENFALLKANTEGANVVAMRAALAARPGRVRLVDPGEGAWGFRTAAAGEAPSSADIAAVTVPDLYAARVDACAPFIVKIDIEGAEADVFSANTDWVDSTPVIAIELHDWLLIGQASARPFLQCVSGRRMAAQLRSCPAQRGRWIGARQRGETEGALGNYRPFHCGGRFWAKARGPSRKSSEVNRAATAS
jgi:FkbM family methyltransferase